MHVYPQFILKSCAIVSILTLLSSLPGFAQTITGTVFRDFNSDGVYTGTPASGTYSYSEPGVGNIIITAYNASGIAVSTTTSATTGAYSLTGLTTGQPYRVEFTNLQVGDYEGFKTTSATGNNATSVQFVTAGATNVNFGINYPNDYCQATPNIIVPCYVNGDPLSTTAGTGSTAAPVQPVVVTLPYNSTGNSPTETPLVRNGEVGTVYGVAYQRQSGYFFSSAFVKRHAGLGLGGAGAIYLTKPSGTTTTTSLFVTLPTAATAVIASGNSVVGSNSARGLPGIITTPNYDVDAFAQVGKAGLGDMDISDDGAQLFVVNLADRKLYQIPIVNANTTNPTAGTSAITSFPLPTTISVAGGSAGALVTRTFRPFALKYYRGQVFVGGVTSNEAVSTTIPFGSTDNAMTIRDTTGMRAIVYKVNLSTGTLTQVLSFPLTYKKGASDNDKTGIARSEYWFPWTDIQPGSSTTLPPSRFSRNDLPNCSYPQAMLTDIEIDIEGSMILGFRDRFGDQYGNNNYGTNTTSTQLYRAISPGEILRAGQCSPGQWTIESNARVCNGTPTLGAGTGQGPGGGEYYYSDAIAFPSPTPYHAEMAQGGLVLLPGYDEVLSTVMDPTTLVDAGGIRRFKMDGSGSPATSAQIFVSGDVATYGKANGLGDVALACAPAPIEIGNRVWRDDNNNGIQDAGEPGIAGVRVTLNGTGLTGVVSVTTNANGEYYFTNTTGTAATGFAYGLSLTPGGSYSLSFPTSYSAYSLSTKPNAATGTNTDNIDTDASATGGISLTLGQSGANNYSYDVGYVPCLPPTVAFTASRSAVCQGTPVTLTTTASPTGTYSYTINAPTGVTLSAANSASAIATGLTAGVNTFTVTVSNGPTCFTTATVSVSVSAAPLVSLSATQSTICAGQTVTINVLGTVLGSMINVGVLDGPGSLLGEVTAIPVSPTVTTTYSVTATSPMVNLGSGCPSIAHTTIIVNPLPILQPVSTTLCAVVGSPVNLSTILTANQSNTALLGLTNVFAGLGGIIANPTAVSLAAGMNSFSVMSTGAGSCTTTTPLTIVLTPEPVLDVRITAVICNPTTNQYTLSGTVSFTNAQASVLTITDGAVSTTIAVTKSTTAVSFTLPAQVSGASTHNVMASSPGCTTANAPIVANATYTAPASCTVGTPLLTLDKRVSSSVAKVGTVLTYSIVVANVGTAAATNVMVTDSSSTGLRYVANSATPPVGTTFTQGNPLSTLTIGTLAAGQSLTLTFQAIADSAGVLYNKASIPGKTVSVCTSVPYRICAGESYVFNLTAPVGRSSYRWFRTVNGTTTELTSFTTNVLQITAAGSYSLSVDNRMGSCPDFSCCPFIIEEDSLPTFAARATPATCTGTAPQANGQLIVSNFRTGYTYQYSLGATFSAATSLSGAAQAIPTNGLIATNLASPVTAQTYTIRVYNAAGCHTDMTVMLMPTVCGCSAKICVPFVVSQTRRPARIGDPR